MLFMFFFLMLKDGRVSSFCCFCLRCSFSWCSIWFRLVFCHTHCDLPLDYRLLFWILLLFSAPKPKSYLFTPNKSKGYLFMPKKTSFNNSEFSCQSWRSWATRWTTRSCTQKRRQSSAKSPWSSSTTALSSSASTGAFSCPNTSAWSLQVALFLPKY